MRKSRWQSPYKAVKIEGMYCEAALLLASREIEHGGVLKESSIQTTERYLGSEQEIAIAVNDSLGL